MLIDIFIYTYIWLYKLFLLSIIRLMFFFVPQIPIPRAQTRGTVWLGDGSYYLT